MGMSMKTEVGAVHGGLVQGVGLMVEDNEGLGAVEGLHEGVKGLPARIDKVIPSDEEEKGVG